MKTTTLKFNLEMNKKSVETAQAKFDNDMNQPTRVSEIAMINEVSHKITKFMDWNEFEFVDDWNTLQPVIARISSMWNDQAELLYDYNFINVYNALSAVDMLSDVEDCIDELMKRERSVYGNVYEISIENVAKYEDLAKAIDNQQVHHCQIGDYVWIDQNEFVCSFHKQNEDMNLMTYCAEHCHTIVYGDTFEEIVAALLTDMDGGYVPSTCVNIHFSH